MSSGAAADEEVATPRPVQAFAYAYAEPAEGDDDAFGSGLVPLLGGPPTHAAHAAPPLPLVTVVSYSLGHVLNDMSAACWFSYLLLYLEEAQQLTPLQAGVVLFMGQLFDGLATPVVGLLSDRSRGWPALGLGRRKLWNAGGTVAVAVCFLGVFATCLACLAAGAGVTAVDKTASFAVFASLFNIGWAAVQVSHMALVPELTADDGERVMLNSARFGMTVMSNCTVFVAMWAILRWSGSSGEADELSSTYRTLSWVVIGVGLSCSVVFLVGTPEAHLAVDGRAAAAAAAARKTSGLRRASANGNGGRFGVGDDGEDGAGGKALKLQELRGQSALASTASAAAAAAAEDEAFAKAASAAFLSVTPGATSAALRPPSASLARVQLSALGAHGRPARMTWRDWLSLRAFYQVMAVYSLTRLATNVSQVYLSFFGRRNSMTIGAVFIAAACTLMLFPTPDSADGVYAAMLLLGAGISITVIISVSMEADLIGSNTESGAFVYGAMSFADKLSNGIAILAVQFVGNSLGDGEAKGNYIRWINGCVPAVAIAAAAAVSWTIAFPKHLQGEGSGGGGRASADSTTGVGAYRAMTVA